MGSNIGAENLGIGAAQIVAVEQRQIDCRAGNETRLTGTKRIRSERRSRDDELYLRPDAGQHRRGAFVANGYTSGDGLDGGEFIRAGQKLDRRRARALESQIDFASMRIEG
jgi:hypothetical protein